MRRLIKSKWAYIKNEQGSSHVLSIGLIMVAILLSFVFFDMYSTFASKNISQTSSDAAALGAAEEIRKTYEDGLKDDLDRLLSSIDEDDEDLYPIKERIEDAAEVNVIESLIDLYNAMEEDNPEEIIFESMCSTIRQSESDIIQVAQHYADENGASGPINNFQFPHDEKFAVILATERDTAFATVDLDDLQLDTHAAAAVKLPKELDYDQNYCG
ncbi:hypothetical protein JCM19037_4657 [Geomicrobium sp. JCM 19037]|uniref:hypothetical protein n=1 Tax=Geomicrobium sp. JCM 19037 TaxID=1460634 RepID=UPI00045F47D3|nr:hypothetical protein [Geomicrobium sp. JCM 19037]GAK06096.1 hypothetical protein JCM19037_4657 [Geomicrobium sp. JCM 19037]